MTRKMNIIIHVHVNVHVNVPVCGALCDCSKLLTLGRLVTLATSVSPAVVLGEASGAKDYLALLTRAALVDGPWIMVMVMDVTQMTLD